MTVNSQFLQMSQTLITPPPAMEVAHGDILSVRVTTIATVDILGATIPQPVLPDLEELELHKNYGPIDGLSPCQWAINLGIRQEADI
ncbi:hypothetical protein HAX54_027468 [Datura stramonium]|uniref:Uncharacterized protein n=1 Tax=Datura stramonium TaxID=4076 RepID=A0ABS8V415_DATST|nr:hypothetical protein [Datura stramonium]